jgi:two-component sensor histidine kinase
MIFRRAWGSRRSLIECLQASPIRSVWTDTRSNTIATVQAISSQTLRGADAAVRAAMEGRLIALASAHDVLTRQSWENAPLSEIVEGALRPFGGRESDKFRISGPPVALPPSAALALSLALHELSTNALKYGALSSVSGSVVVTWEITGDLLRFGWEEHGGPRVGTPRAARLRHQARRARRRAGPRRNVARLLR